MKRFVSLLLLLSLTACATGFHGFVHESGKGEDHGGSVSHDVDGGHK